MHIRQRDSLALRGENSTFTLHVHAGNRFDMDESVLDSVLDVVLVEDFDGFAEVGVHGVSFWEGEGTKAEYHALE